jgi:hypothetical protein
MTADQAASLSLADVKAIIVKELPGAFDVKKAAPKAKLRRRRRKNKSVSPSVFHPARRAHGGDTDSLLGIIIVAKSASW